MGGYGYFLEPHLIIMSKSGKIKITL